MHTFKNNTSSFTSTSNNLNPVFTTDYNEDIAYDPNGNILKYRRYGNSASQGTTNQSVMDSLSYNYFPGTNQLKYIKDTVSAASFMVDIDNQTLKNYGYDAIGNMVKDSLAGIDSIKWTVYGKIQTIYKHNGTVINYSYDAAGNRITKVITGGTSGNGETWYVHDASGNVMSIYTVNSGTLSLSEQEIYGSSRLGMVKPGLNLSNYTAPTKINMSSLGSVGYFTTFTRGQKFFELDNHLGNVLVTVSDKKFGVSTSNNSVVNYYTPDIVSAQDYYPGGMFLPGRDTNYKPISYRYGFNGQEQSTELNSTGNLYNADFWEYDSRIVKRWNVDPRSDAAISPYNCFAGNPIWFSDPLGDTIKIYGTAEATNTTLNDKGGTADLAQNATYYKDAKLVPAINPNTNKLIGYNVFDTKNTDRQSPVIQIEAGDMEAFKTNYSQLFTAQRLYYSSGEPSEGMKKFGAAIDVENGFNFNLALSGIKLENKAAWSNPVFVTQMLLSTAHMSVDIAQGEFYKPNGGTIKEDFVSDHAYNKHSYQASIPSTRNRTQFGQNINIRKVTETTIKYGTREVQYNALGNPYAVKYSYEFKGNVSTANTPTGKVRVFINLNDASSSSVFPYYR